MSDHPSLHRNNIRPEFRAADGAGAGAPSLGRVTARETNAALKAWSKKHPSPFNFCRKPKPISQ